jgi:hypothetical protein
MALVRLGAEGDYERKLSTLAYALHLWVVEIPTDMKPTAIRRQTVR